jgi:membrane-bound serine protease (ClpP class)
LSSLTLAYVLIALGILLLGAELLFPSGVLLVLAVSSLAVGVALTFAYNTTTGILTLVAVAVGLPVAGRLVIRYWPTTRIGKQLFLGSPDEGATVASMPINQELERLRGRYGKTVTALRPAGITEFDGQRVDTITEGLMVEPGQWVRCVDVRAGKVIVRPVERPGLGDLETANFG